MERKLMRSGNGWAIFINSTILELLKINPETDKVEFSIENDTLKIKKAPPSAEQEKPAKRKSAAKKSKEEK